MPFVDQGKNSRSSEYRNEWRRKWRREHPEVVQAKSRRRHLRVQNDPALREKRNALLRKHYHGPAKIKWREARKKWLVENPEKWAQQQKRRIERKPWLRALTKARARCKESGLENTLTNAWAEARYTGACELTGLKFVINGKTNPYSISLDRIDSSRGYTPDNCRFILWALNRFKGEDSDSDMAIIAKAFLDRQ